MNPNLPEAERVADYPRPPALVASDEHVRVEALGQLLVDTHRSLRVLETFHPPTYYLPPEAMQLALLQPAPGRSFCEWKGVARYCDVVLDPGGRPSAACAGLCGPTPSPPRPSRRWRVGLPCIQP